MLPKSYYRFFSYLTFKKTKVTAILIVLYLLLPTQDTFSQSTNCQAKIIVEENGNVDSVSENGVLYKMLLTNTGTTTDNYKLSVVNVNSTSKNPDESSTQDNVALKTIFLNQQKNEITEIIINAGETFSFYSMLTIPTGTPFSKWSNNQIIATSSNCPTYKTDTVLHTYVLNPDSN